MAPRTRGFNFRVVRKSELPIAWTRIVPQLPFSNDNVQSGRNFSTTRRTLLFPSAGYDTILHSNVRTKIPAVNAGLLITAPLLRTIRFFPPKKHSTKPHIPSAAGTTDPQAAAESWDSASIHLKKLRAGTKSHGVPFRSIVSLSARLRLAWKNPLSTALAHTFYIHIQTSSDIFHGLQNHNSELMDIAYHLPIKPDLENKLSFACDCLVPKEEPGYNCYCFELQLLFNQTT